MAIAGTYDIKTDENSDYQQPLIWKRDGVAVNLSGYTAKMQLRGKFDFVYELSTSNGRINITEDNVIILNISSTAMKVWPAKQLNYDLVLTSSTGVVRTLVRGKFRINPGVTV